jgi:hypothetical protein
MDNRERVQRLRSNDTQQILEALRDLKLDRNTPPSDEVVDAGMRLLESADVEVRYETVWALCLHWGDTRTLPGLRTLLEEGKEDLEVRLIAARAVGSIGARIAKPDKESLRLLARIALDDGADAELRGTAYIGLRSAARLLTAQERGRLPEDIHQLGVDWEWLRAMSS